MKDAETIDEYFAKTLAIVNRMKMHKEKMEAVMIVGKILRLMTIRFNYVLCSLKNPTVSRHFQLTNY